MRDIGRALREARPLILTIALIMTLVGLAAALLLTPTYRSEVLLSHVSDSDSSGGMGALANQFSGIAGLAGINLPGDDNKQNIVLATLKSRAFTTDFVDRHGLKHRLFDDRWDPDNKDWLADEEPPTDFEVYERFDSIRGVTEDNSTGLIKVAITWKDRHEAASWTNQLIGDLNLHLREDSIAESEKSISYLREELDKTSIVEIQQAVFRLIENQISQIMLASVRDDYALAVIDSAVVADEGDYASPSKILIAIVFALAGLVFGIFAALIRYALRRD